MPTRLARPALAAALLALALPAQADTALTERYIAASEQLSQSMLSALASCAPGLNLTGTELAYTPAMRNAVSCVIDSHLDRFGRAETEAMIAEAEAMSARGFSSLAEMAAMQADYPRLSAAHMMELNQSCGTIEASQDLPLTRLMAQNMGQIAACFQ